MDDYQSIQMIEILKIIFVKSKEEKNLWSNRSGIKKVVIKNYERNQINLNEPP